MKYKIGDKVRTKFIPNRWSSKSLYNKYCKSSNKISTITRISMYQYQLDRIESTILFSEEELVPLYNIKLRLLLRRA